MTDYETASLALQQAGVEIGRAGVRATYVRAGVALIIGGFQCGLIYYGLRLMSKGSTERTTQLTTQHAETMAAHAETMAAHAETMAVMQTRHAENMAAHAESMTALKELIRRTAPRS